MKGFKRFLASPMLMAVLIVVFAVSCALATFVENDFGTRAAWALVYHSWWFELVMLLLAANFLAMIFTRKLYAKAKFPIMLFHLGFVIIILGAGITRYTGQEGMMHIREGQTKGWFSSTDKWISIYHNGKSIAAHSVMLTPVSKNRFSKSVSISSRKAEVRLLNFIPHAIERIENDPHGQPMVLLYLVSPLQSQSVLVKPNHPLRVNGISVGFKSDGQDYTLALEFNRGAVLVHSSVPVEALSMGSEGREQLTLDEPFVLTPQTLYDIGELKLAHGGHWEMGMVKMVYNPDSRTGGTDAIALRVKYDGIERTIYVPMSGADDMPVYEDFNGEQLGFHYGSMRIDLPFELKLNQFVLERYPGSDSPSSFTSHVQIIDTQKGVEKPFSIFMNNILSYSGYRFYQSSYDEDEQGTYLSVNKDFMGTLVTYLGYLVLTIGIVGSLFSRGSRFRKLIQKPASTALVAMLLFGAGPLFAQEAAPVISQQHAYEFGALLTQDKGGRIKPISTLSGEVLRKLNRSTKFQGQSPEQVYLGMSVFPDYWQHTAMIKVKNKELTALLGIEGNKAAFVDFFNHGVDGSYKLSRFVQEAFAQKPAQRTAFQKEVIKADEKVNILYMIFSGQMARIFPSPNHPENLWLSMDDASKDLDTLYISRFSTAYSQYVVSVRNAAQSGSWSAPSKLLQRIDGIQQQYGGEVLPNSPKVRAELLSNRLLIFERLIPLYGITGFLLLLIVFLQIFTTRQQARGVMQLFRWVLIFGFAAQTFGIALRWYIAGRAPLSNGYESMVYVAWAAMLAGFIFARRNRVVLPATALLSTLILFVAHLSWMDPEITNLVPVLKSYWLTIHVAVITASYGFFGLAAILGLFNILLYAFQNQKNHTALNAHIESISVINELNMTLGLYLLTIGSFLGAVWANESWGRYWGWDPKETWALITMLVYAFVLHMRLIPSFKSTFALNLGSLVGIGAVLMTYFGVNYYLSGLHSYAGGDSMPFPKWLIAIAIGVLVLSFYAWYNSKRVAPSHPVDAKSKTKQ